MHPRNFLLVHPCVCTHVLVYTLCTVNATMAMIINRCYCVPPYKGCTTYLSHSSLHICPHVIVTDSTVYGLYVFNVPSYTSGLTKSAVLGFFADQYLKTICTCIMLSVTSGVTPTHPKSLAVHRIVL